MSKRIGQKQAQYRRAFFREWREAAHLSQDQAVERIRELIPTFAKSALSRLENGRQAYTQPVLEALALAYGCQAQDLIMRKPGPSEIWSLMDTLEALPPEDRQAVTRIIAGLRRTG